MLAVALSVLAVCSVICTIGMVRYSVITVRIIRRSEVSLEKQRERVESTHVAAGITLIVTTASTVTGIIGGTILGLGVAFALLWLVAAYAGIAAIALGTKAVDKAWEGKPRADLP